MRVACIRYKSNEDEEKTLKKIIPLIHIASKKSWSYVSPECATFLNVSQSETMINESFEKNSFSLKTMKKTAKTLHINILIGS